MLEDKTLGGKNVVVKEFDYSPRCRHVAQQTWQLNISLCYPVVGKTLPARFPGQDIPGSSVVPPFVFSSSFSTPGYWLFRASLF